MLELTVEKIIEQFENDLDEWLMTNEHTCNCLDKTSLFEDNNARDFVIKWFTKILTLIENEKCQ